MQRGNSWKAPEHQLRSLGRELWVHRPIDDPDSLAGINKFVRGYRALDKLADRKSNKYSASLIYPFEVKGAVKNSILRNVTIADIADRLEETMIPGFNKPLPVQLGEMGQHEDKISFTLDHPRLFDEIDLLRSMISDMVGSQYEWRPADPHISVMLGELRLFKGRKKLERALPNPVILAAGKISLK